MVDLRIFWPCVWLSRRRLGILSRWRRLSTTVSRLYPHNMKTFIRCWWTHNWRRLFITINSSKPISLWYLFLSFVWLDRRKSWWVFSPSSPYWRLSLRWILALKSSIRIWILSFCPPTRRSTIMLQNWSSSLLSTPSVGMFFSLFFYGLDWLKTPLSDLHSFKNVSCCSDSSRNEEISIWTTRFTTQLMFIRNNCLVLSAFWDDLVDDIQNFNTEAIQKAVQYITSLIEALSSTSLSSYSYLYQNASYIHKVVQRLQQSVFLDSSSLFGF